MNLEDLHGILVTDIGNVYIKASVYYTSGWNQNNWDENVIIPNKVSSIFSKEDRQITIEKTTKDQINLQLAKINPRYSEIAEKINKILEIEALPLQRLKRFRHPINALFYWSSYEYLCQEISQRLELAEKIEGWGLDAPFERRYWGIFTTYPHYELIRDQKRKKEMHRRILKELGFGYYTIEERSYLSVFNYYQSIFDKQPTNALVIDVGATGIRTTAMRIEDYKRDSIVDFLPEVIPESTKIGIIGGTKVEELYWSSMKSQFEEIFPNLNEALEKFLFEGGGAIRCYKKDHPQGISQTPFVSIGENNYEFPEKLKWLPTLIFEPENYDIKEPQKESILNIIHSTLHAAEVQGYELDNILSNIIISGGVAEYSDFQSRIKEEIESRYIVYDPNYYCIHRPIFSTIEGQKVITERALKRKAFNQLFIFLKPRWL